MKLTVRASELKPGDRIIDSDGVGATVLEARSKNAFWYIVKRGEASVLSLAIKLAFAAPEKAV